MKLCEIKLGMAINPNLTWPDLSLTGKIRFDRVSSQIRVKPDLYKTGEGVGMKILIPDPYPNPYPTQN